MRRGNMNSNKKYIASLTREPFLFYEMRVVAKLIVDGLNDKEIIERISKENLFQYPTEKSIKRMVICCIKRLKEMNDETLVTAVATQSSDVAKQICLYALMKQSRLVSEFMMTVIGEKYRLKDSSFGKMDLNIFFLRLQEQNDAVSTWSDSTIAKLKQILTKILVENKYLDDIRSERLNPVWLQPILENAIKSNNEMAILPAFNCFV